MQRHAADVLDMTAAAVMTSDPDRRRRRRSRLRRPAAHGGPPVADLGPARGRRRRPLCRSRARPRPRAGRVCRLLLVRILGVIPARMAPPGSPASRWSTWPAARSCSGSTSRRPAARDLDDLVVATPDEEIAEAVAGFGGAVELDAAPTTRRAPTGSPRSPARRPRRRRRRQRPGRPAVRHPRDAAARWSARTADGASPVMTTVGAPLDAASGPDDPNVVKVICDRTGDALYFSRSPIPYRRNPVSEPLARLPPHRAVRLHPGVPRPVRDARRPRRWSRRRASSSFARSSTATASGSARSTAP